MTTNPKLCWEKNTFLSAFNVRANKKEDTLFWTVIELQFMLKMRRKNWVQTLGRSEIIWAVQQIKCTALQKLKILKLRRL